MSSDIGAAVNVWKPELTSCSSRRPPAPAAVPVLSSATPLEASRRWTFPSATAGAFMAAGALRWSPGPEDDLAERFGSKRDRPVTAATLLPKYQITFRAAAPPTGRCRRGEGWCVAGGGCRGRYRTLSGSPRGLLKAVSLIILPSEAATPSVLHETDRRSVRRRRLISRGCSVERTPNGGRM